MRIKAATSFQSRLCGLLGTDPRQLGFDALHLIPCGDVHTFGMRYALDIAFLDHRNRVITICRGVRPNRLCFAPRGTASVLERPAQKQSWVLPGDFVKGAML